MARKKFDSSLIKTANNPFPQIRAKAIHDGIAIRDGGDEISVAGGKKKIADGYIPDTDGVNFVDIGLHKSLQSKFKNIIASNTPEPILILADFGHGKSGAIKQIQDTIISRYYYPIISIAISSSASRYLESKEDILLRDIINYLAQTYNALPVDVYTNKDAVKTKYKLDEETTQYTKTIQTFDTAFKELGCLVFIFIDELDKITTYTDSSNKGLDNNKKVFIENLKTIAETCRESVSLWVAGTNNVDFFISELGDDYLQRFTKVENNNFTKTDTLTYINEKSLKVVGYYGYIPIKKNVIEKIHTLAKGNIRRINCICKELWNLSAIMRKQIGIQEYNEFICEKLKEPIKRLFPDADNIHIKFLAELVSYEKVSRLLINHYKSSKKVYDYIKTQPDKIKQVDRSYKLDDSLKQKLLESVNL